MTERDLELFALVYCLPWVMSISAMSGGHCGWAIGYGLIDQALLAGAATLVACAVSVACVVAIVRRLSE
jgi:hypothetical protein